MKRNVIIAVIAVAGLGFLGLLVANTRSQQKAAISVQATPTVVQNSPTPIAVTGSIDATSSSQIKEIVVTGSSFKFTPSEIKVKKGDKVKIVFKSLGGKHDLVIDKYNVQTDVIDSGEEDIIEFTADKVGTFEYYCSIGNHRQMGMVGKLIVQ